MFKAGKLAGLVVGVMLGTSVAAQAGPIQGGFSITGNFLPVVGSTGAPTSLQLATGLDFINLFGSLATPGGAGTIQVNSANGDFSSLVNTTGTIRDFSFAGGGSSSFPSTTLLAFQQLGALTFDLLSISVVLQMQQFLALSGSGIFHKAGFQDTYGTFSLTGNGANNTFSFSASQGAGAAVPEPAALLLLSVGLLSAAAFLRRVQARA